MHPPRHSKGWSQQTDNEVVQAENKAQSYPRLWDLELCWHNYPSILRTILGNVALRSALVTYFGLNVAVAYVMRATAVEADCPWETVGNESGCEIEEAAKGLEILSGRRKKACSKEANTGHWGLTYLGWTRELAQRYTPWICVRGASTCGKSSQRTDSFRRCEDLCSCNTTNQFSVACNASRRQSKLVSLYCETSRCSETTRQQVDSANGWTHSLDFTKTSQSNTPECRLAESCC